jgi:hypothetical protein
LWINDGDLNTKYFHCFANNRRIQNTIWDIKGADDVWTSDPMEIQREGVKYFSDIFKKPVDSNITQMLKVINLFPRYFSEEDGQALFKEVTTDEILGVLKGFKKDKSPGPDGWSVEFYLEFFELLKNDLVEMIEEIRVSGIVPPVLNATFIAIIPKVGKPESFQDFRPISLCNLCYKIMTKILANKLKPILTLMLSPEQFGFLKDRNIMDAVGIAQEGLHTIKTKKKRLLSLN